MPALLGRSSSCSVRIDDPSASRQHCRLDVENDRIVLTDLNSTHGTWYGDERITRQTLQPEGSFRIGDTSIRITNITKAADQDSPPENPDPMLGTEIAGYKILKILGRGGYGIVYHARQDRLNRHVALKLLKEDACSDSERVEAFQREARAAASLDHPHLIQLYEVGEVDGRHFFAMELVGGGNVAQHIKAHGPFAWENAVKIAIDVMEALAHAHQKGLVHGDVKPANILLSKDRRAKLGDLGLATTAEEASDTRMGTVAFMSPEQILGNKLDSRSDLYSFGCTFFTMVTGKRLFPHASSKEVLTSHLRKAPPTLSGSGVAVPRLLDHLINRLLTKTPDQRPESAREVVNQLRRLTDSSSPPPRSAKSLRRSRPSKSLNPLILAWYAMLYLVAIATIIITGMWLAQKI